MVAAFRDPLLNCYSTAVSQYPGSSMTMTVRSTVDTLAFEQSQDPAYELKSHPAFYPQTTKERAETLLIGTQPMTYLLWEDRASAGQYFLSYMKRDLEVEHVILCPHQAVTLLNLIPLLMTCPPNECKMLLNPSYYRRYEC
jgi:hypothetical protein